MDPRFVTQRMHAYLDYPVALALMTLPFALQLGTANPMAKWLSVGVGIAAFALTLLTNHHLGLIRVLPYRFHLAVDFLVGALFLAAPSMLGLSGLDALFYWLNGAAVLTVVSLHKPEPAHALSQRQPERLAA